jgi:hyperosmotically inducible periplasmic protein
MHENCSKVRPLLVMLALLTTPGLFFAQFSAGDNLSSSTRASSDASSVPPNDSGRNIRDRGSDAVTPFTQSSNPADVEMTRQIRRALMNDNTLSTTARNVKVISVGGTVILRGPVKSEHEKVAIAHKALQIAGSGHVNDQLEIAGR